MVTSPMSAACAAAVLGRACPPRPTAPFHARARRSRGPRGRSTRVLASVGASPCVPAPAEVFSSLGASVAMVSGTTAGMPTETVGVLAAAATPLLGAIGLFIWSKVWTGDAFALNLVKCSVGTIGFVVAGVASRSGAWLSNASAEVTAWLVLSAFIGIVVGDNLWLYSLRVIGARRVILIDILKPFIALGMAKAALGEGVSVAVALGMCVTLGGVLTVSLEENRTGDEENGDVDRDPVINDTNARFTETDVAETSDVEGVVGAVDEYETPEQERVSASSAPRRNPAGLKTKTLKPPFSPSVFVGGYVAAAANVALDTWGTVLTKQHGGGLNTWEINFVRFGSAAATPRSSRRRSERRRVSDVGRRTFRIATPRQQTRQNGSFLFCRSGRGFKSCSGFRLRRFSHPGSETTRCSASRRSPSSRRSCASGRSTRCRSERWSTTSPSPRAR